MNDKRSLLELLKAELEFVSKGGYRNTARVAWRPHFIFQDSPSCLNFDPTHEQRPCSDCALMQVIPPQYRDQKIPCRHIPLNEKGETIDSFYRGGNEAELEAALVSWLKTAIAGLEAEKAAGQSRGTAREAACGK